ncbi:hypothetical protein ACFU6E_05345 [Bacillus cereus]|uniref:hypothetical protein n=1 Tax=Bacillus cereus TaxID=1396 RepID=UPI003672F45B|nr:hypothetical protein [Bacillus cereus]
MEKGWLMPSFFVVEKVFPEPVFISKSLFYVKTGKKSPGMRISFCRRISSARAFAS